MIASLKTCLTTHLTSDAFGGFSIGFLVLTPIALLFNLPLVAGASICMFLATLLLALAFHRD
jgi:hypothetical protein